MLYVCLYIKSHLFHVHVCLCVRTRGGRGVRLPPHAQSHWPRTARQRGTPLPADARAPEGRRLAIIGSVCLFITLNLDVRMFVPFVFAVVHVYVRTEKNLAPSPSPSLPLSLCVCACVYACVFLPCTHFILGCIFQHVFEERQDDQQPATATKPVA